MAAQNTNSFRYVSRWRSHHLGAVLVLATTMAGCGGGAEIPKDRLKTTPVSGVVKLDGEPVQGATVTFHAPASGSSGKPVPSAVGQTDSSGKYRLTTYEANDGAVPESYFVSVKKIEAPAATGNTGGEYVPPKPNAKPEAPKYLVPEKYTNQLKSGLTATVVEGKENTFDLELKSK